MDENSEYRQPHFEWRWTGVAYVAQVAGGLIELMVWPIEHENLAGDWRVQINGAVSMYLLHEYELIEAQLSAEARVLAELRKALNDGRAAE